MLVVWKLDRLGRNLAQLVKHRADLSARGVGLRLLAGDGAQIDTTTAAGCRLTGRALEGYLLGLAAAPARLVARTAARSAAPNSPRLAPGRERRSAGSRRGPGPSVPPTGLGSPARRARKREDEPPLERGRLDAVITGLLFMGGMGERPALGRRGRRDRRRRGAGHRPPEQDEPGGRDEGRS